MTDRRTLFRRVLDSVVVGRSRQARHYIDRYLESHPELTTRRD